MLPEGGWSAGFPGISRQKTDELKQLHYEQFCGGIHLSGKGRPSKGIRLKKEAP
jgi:hypothetical protein